MNRDNCNTSDSEPFSDSQHNSSHVQYFNTSRAIQSSDINKKYGPGTSCHQCKNRQDSLQLVLCTNNNKLCKKKYCLGCLSKFYSISRSGTKDFTCPACKRECTCAACRKSTTKDKKDQSDDEVVLGSRTRTKLFAPSRLSSRLSSSSSSSLSSSKLLSNRYRLRDRSYIMHKSTISPIEKSQSIHDSCINEPQHVDKQDHILIPQLPQSITQTFQPLNQLDNFSLLHNYVLDELILITHYINLQFPPNLIQQFTSISSQQSSLHQLNNNISLIPSLTSGVTLPLLSSSSILPQSTQRTELKPTVLSSVIIEKTFSNDDINNNNNRSNNNNTTSSTTIKSNAFDVPSSSSLLPQSSNPPSPPLSSSTSSLSPSLFCYLCQEYTYYGMIEHAIMHLKYSQIQTAHRIKDNNEIDINNFCCDGCKISFSNPFSLNQHMISRHFVSKNNTNQEIIEQNRRKSNHIPIHQLPPLSTLFKFRGIVFILPIKD